MKKNFTILFCLCMILLISGCKGKKKENEDIIEIKDGFITYAIRDREVNEKNIEIFTEKIVRYDKDGNFKYFELTNNAKIPDDYQALGKDTADMNDAQLAALICKSPSRINQFDELKRICQVKDRVYKEGYSLTNITVREVLPVYETIFISDVKNMIDEYSNFDTEDKAKEYFEKYKNDLKKSEKDILIIANKEIKLSN